VKKVILFDDRASRQTLFFEETKVDFTLYDDVLVNVSGVEACQEKMTQLLNNHNVLDAYQTILVHKSILPEINSEILNILKINCQENAQNLVLFSGGIDTVFYTQEPSVRLELNSKTFYSKHLGIFLEKAKEGIQMPLILAYGDKWELNIVLDVIEKVGLFIQNNDDTDIVYDDFELSTGVQLLDGIVDYDDINIENGWTTRGEINKVFETLKLKITEMVATNV